MKKYITVSLFIFWAITVAVLTAGLISYNNNQSNVLLNANNPTGQIGSITGIDSSVATLTLSKTELAKHNSAQSCWLLISGKIYDVTSFLNQHPGNASTILPTCGTDATVDYNTKDRPNARPHSASANAMLVDYFIGNLNQVLKIGSGKTSSPTPTTTKSNTQNKTIPPVITPPIIVNPNTSNATLTLTSLELAKHNSAQSCWLLISGKIYDVTSFLNQHPGNASTILPTCGTDATVAFDTRGGTGAHSSSAFAMLAAYYIGDLNQTVNTSPTSPNTPPVVNPNPVIPPRGGGEFDD